MKKIVKFFFLLLLFIQLGALAQTDSSSAANPVFSQQELDQMLAPVALYPDSLLTLVLTASTYPLEVVQAAHWSSANASLTGNDAVMAVDDQNWDPSVKSLIAFPDVLQTMENKIDWTERLGDAFLTQQPQVMDTVQALRKKAQMAGNLNSNSQVSVSQANNVIEVAPVNPEVIYVPYYDPMVIYGTWWWPAYPPVYWGPWSGYGGYDGYAWGLGIGIGAAIIIGTWDWHNHLVYIHNPHLPDNDNPWTHNPIHRHAVPYRTEALNRQYGRSNGARVARPEFRGHIPSHPESTLKVQQQTRVEHNAGNSQTESRAHAFENIGHGSEVRNFIERGHASVQSGTAKPAPARDSSTHTKRKF